MSEPTAYLWTREGVRFEGAISHGVPFARFLAWATRQAEACPCDQCIKLAVDAPAIFGVSLLATKAPVTEYEAECIEIVLLANGGPAPNGD